MSQRKTDPVEKILGYAQRIAVVGLSDDPYRASYGVAAALLREGFEVVPVNPTLDHVFGLRSYPSLAEVPGEIDLVDVFRRPEHLEAVAREAAGVGARALWLQLGLRSREARRIAEEAGMDYVEDLCLKIEVARLGRVITLPDHPSRRGTSLVRFRGRGYGPPSEVRGVQVEDASAPGRRV